MKKKMITLTLLSLFAVVGCNEVPTETTKPATDTNPATEGPDTGVQDTESTAKPRTFDDMYDDLKKPMTVTGDAKVILIDSKNNTSITQNNTIKVLFGENSFHIEQTGESESIISTIYTNETGKALHYYITPTNTIDYEVITTRTGEEVLFKEYDNPFKYVSSNIFMEKSESEYEVVLDDDNYKADYNFLVNNLTYINFESLAQTYSETFEDITLKIENQKIVGMHILSKAFTDAISTTQFEWDLNFDYSEETDHSYPLPTPLETKDYHNTLKTALNNLMDPNQPYTANYSVDYYGMTYQFESYFDNSVIYADTEDDTEFTDGTAFIQKEDGVHKVVKSGDDFAYEPAVYEDQSGKYTNLSQLYPSLAIAIEWFEYNEENGTYFLNSSSAGAFGFKILTLGFVDVQVATAESVVITLSEDKKHVEKMVFDDSMVVATFDYNKKATLPFKVEELQEKNPFKGFGGTYEAEISDTETMTIIVDEENKTITVNGTLATDCGANRYGELEFTYNGINYSIAKNKNRLYDNTNGGTYSLTKKE